MVLASRLAGTILADALADNGTSLRSFRPDVVGIGWPGALAARAQAIALPEALIELFALNPIAVSGPGWSVTIWLV